MLKKDVVIGIIQNKKEFEKLYDQHFNALCAFAYKYVKDISIVEDMVQESFISCWERRTDFKVHPAVKSFLYTSLKNRCINYLKHQKVILKHEKNLIQLLETDQEFNQHVIEEETFNALFQEIRNLPKSSQEIMLLALNGLKNPEIAEELNVSVNTVKTQKKIAYAKLKVKLKPADYAILLTL